MRRSRWLWATNSRGSPCRPGGSRASSGGYSGDSTDWLAESLTRTEYTDLDSLNSNWPTSQFVYAFRLPGRGRFDAPGDFRGRHLTRRFCPEVRSEGELNQLGQ